MDKKPETKPEEPRKNYSPPSSDGIVKAVVNLQDIMLKPRRPRKMW